MWLPDALLVFVSISQLLIHTDASLGESSSRLWLAGNNEKDFLKDVRKHGGASTESSASSTKSQGTWTSSFGSRKSPPARTLTHEETIAYFNKAYGVPFVRNLKQIKLVHQVLNYLLRHESMPMEHLEEWCVTLADKMVYRRGTGVIATSILYAFHTLILRHLYDEPFKEKIVALVNRTLPTSCIHPNRMDQWTRELLQPQHGLSPSFRTSVKQLLNEPRLKPLTEAIIEGNSRVITYNLNEIMHEIFSINPASDLSSETRVASIAILYHLLHTDRQHIKQQVVQLIKSLRKEKEHFYFFNHEIELLRVLWKDCCIHGGLVQTHLPALHAFDVSSLTMPPLSHPQTRPGSNPKLLMLNRYSKIFSKDKKKKIKLIAD